MDIVFVTVRAKGYNIRALLYNLNDNDTGILPFSYSAKIMIKRNEEKNQIRLDFSLILAISLIYGNFQEIEHTFIHYFQFDQI